MNKKKFLSVLLVFAMVITVLAACSSNGNNEEQQGNSKTTTPTNNSNVDQGNELEPYEIVMAMPVFGAISADMALIEEGINEIIQPQINATLKILPISIGAWSQQLNLMTSGGEKLDTFFSFGQGYASDVAMGKIIEIDGLLDEYGQELKGQFDSAYLDAARVNGKLYGVPNLQEFTTGTPGLVMRKDLVDKYDIDVSTIHSLDDLDSVFEIIKQNEPGVTPLSITLASPIEQYRNFDPLGDSLGVLPNYDNELKVENLYESQWYEDTLVKLHSWFKAGYINKDAATANNFVHMNSGTIFSNFANNQVGFMEGQEKAAGMELLFVPLIEEVYSTTSNVLSGLWPISQNSTNPERVMMFLNLMYTDPAIANLLMWGVEGKHYVKVTDNTIDFPEGLTQSTVGYENQAWLIGNAFNTYVYKTELPNKWELTKEANQNAIKSKALGFSFNQEAVKNEITAVNNVVTNYAKALETGTVDPKAKLQEFRDKLKNAGIDKVITEKQKQLDEWAAANQ